MIIYIRRITTGGSLWELVSDNREDEYRGSVEQNDSYYIDAQRLWEERQMMEGHHGTK